jgi:hypothetical protein
MVRKSNKSKLMHRLLLDYLLISITYRMKFAFIVFISLIAFQNDFAYSQSNKYFEGVLRYKYYYTDLNGNELSFPIEEDEEYRDETHIIFRVIRGEDIKLRGNQDIYLDRVNMEMLRIDHDRKIISRMQNNRIDKINPIEFRNVGEDTIMNYLCDIYFVKYVQKLDYIKQLTNSQYTSDTVSCNFYIAKDLKISNPEPFARLQGYHNSRLIDGRFSGIALKVIRENSNGTTIVMEVTKIEEGDIQNFIKLPSYSFEDQ